MLWFQVSTILVVCVCVCVCVPMGLCVFAVDFSTAPGLSTTAASIEIEMQYSPKHRQRCE